VDKNLFQRDVTDERDVIFVYSRPTVMTNDASGGPDEHTEVGTDEGGEEHVCEACERAFESRAALDRHVHDVGLVD
jgi:hypothetical protein